MSSSKSNGKRTLSEGQASARGRAHQESKRQKVTADAASHSVANKTANNAPLNISASRTQKKAIANTSQSMIMKDGSAGLAWTSSKRSESNPPSLDSDVDTITDGSSVHSDERLVDDIQAQYDQSLDPRASLSNLPASHGGFSLTQVRLALLDIDNYSSRSENASDPMQLYLEGKNDPWTPLSAKYVSMT